MIDLYGRPYVAADAEIVRRHTATGLRSFVQLDRLTVRDLFARGATVSPGPRPVYLAGGTGIRFESTGASGFTLVHPNYSRRGGFTVIVKMVTDAGNSGAMVDQRFQPGDTGNLTYTDTGAPGFYVVGGGGGGNYAIRADLDTAALSMAGRYKVVGREMRIFASGRNARGAASNPTTTPDDRLFPTPPTLDFGRPTTNPSVSHYAGTIMWMAEFNRALHRDEIMRWATGDFLRDDDEMLIGALVPPTVVNYATGSGVLSVGVIDAPVYYATASGSGDAGAGDYPMSLGTLVSLDAFCGGDIGSAPSLTGPAVYTTTTGVGQFLASGPPDVVVYGTVTQAGAAYTADVYAVYATTVGVQTAAVALLDGRIDLLETTRYRR